MREDCPIIIDKNKISEFCRKWRIVEFSFFGSVLNEKFNSGSDVDVLVVFEPNAPWSLWELIDMQEELEKLFGRKVDLIEKDGVMAGSDLQNSKISHGGVRLAKFKNQL